MESRYKQHSWRKGQRVCRKAKRSNPPESCERGKEKGNGTMVSEEKVKQKDITDFNKVPEIGKEIENLGKEMWCRG